MTLTSLDEPILRLRQISVHIATPYGVVCPVDHVDLTIPRGQTVAVVGESGSGKSTLAGSIMGLLPSTGFRVGGQFEFDGRDLRTLSERERSQLRGSRMAMIFQDPATSLNPMQRVGKQVAEAFRIHHADASKAESKRRALDLLEAVGITSPEERYRSYPHELSGGMRQRVMLAMALINEPDLIIADEPTTALDVTIQAQVLRLMNSLQRRMGMGMLFITHNLGVVATTADRVAVMYAGQIVEEGPVKQVLSAPRHPYTRALIEAVPRMDARYPLPAGLSGAAVGARNRPDGCRFHPRCPFATKTCSAEIPVLRALPDEQREVRCHWAEMIEECHPVAESQPLGSVASEPKGHRDLQPLLTVKSLSHTYPSHRLTKSKKPGRPAVDTVTFDLSPSSTLGVVGESGSGKTTLARSIVRLVEPTEGSVQIAGVDILSASRRSLRALRQDMQFVFQDPFESLDPLWSVESIVREPLKRLALGAKEERRRVNEMLEKVGLSAQDGRRRPHAFSGGERQRISLARALVVRPRVLILDEPTASLDVSIQAKMIQLLRDIQDEESIAYLFITHDLSLMRQLADDLVVMHHGRIVEHGSAAAVFDAPQHPYTKQLLDAVPSLHGATPALWVQKKPRDIDQHTGRSTARHNLNVQQER